NEEEDKGEAGGEDSTVMETQVAPPEAESDTFAPAVAGHLSTPGEKEPIEEISITTDVPEHTEAAAAEPMESQPDSPQEQATSEPVSEPAETSDAKEVEAVTEPAETVDTGADTQATEDVTKSVGD